MSDFPTRFWLARRVGAEDWDVVVDVAEAERLSANPNCEVLPCSPRPAELPVGLDELAAEIHNHGRAKGFWDRATIELPEDPTERFTPPRRVDNPSVLPEKLALVHSEVSEALDALRDGDHPHFAEELADVLIRTLDVAAYSGLSMDIAVAAKMAKNLDRPHLNGRRW